MADKPIIFSAPMVKALIEGRKTQTRRVLKPPSEGATPQYYGGDWRWWTWTSEGEGKPGSLLRLPGAPGDLLYVREAHSLHNAFGQHREDSQRWGPWSGLPTRLSPDGTQIAYFREGFDRCDPGRWRPSIHMPRWASRLTLTVTDVRVQRLQEISEEDARAEGLSTVTKDGELWKWGIADRDGLPGNDDTGWPWQDWERDPRAAFARLWNSLHGPDAWAANPWVVALTFTVERRNIDEAPHA